MTRRAFTAAFAACIVGLSSFAFAADKAADGKKKVLFFSQSCGFRHSTVTRPLTGEPAFAEKMMKELGEKAGYEVFFSQDPHDLDKDDDFKQFDAIIFYTTGNPNINRGAFMKWLESGKAFIAIHCGADTFWHDVGLQGGGNSKSWPEYNQMLGGAFKGHNKQSEVILTVEDKNHPATKQLEDGWAVTDEIYQFSGFSKDRVHPLLSINTEKTDLEPQKMEKGKYYPVAWTRNQGKGRVFYTSLGHREDVWTNPKYQAHLMGGIAWALGEKE